MWGEEGNDTMQGDIGKDVLGGGDGADSMAGGAGNDTLYGDLGNDTLAGDDGNDELHGADGFDSMSGGAGNDMMYGGADNDTLLGGDGKDTLYGSEGGDVISGGAGRDAIKLWEDVQARDTIVFAAGDSGITRSTMDVVEGFQTGVDKIDLSAFGGLTFEATGFAASGSSAYYDGHFLQIDSNGDRAADMMIEFAWTMSISTGDILLA
jgi:Ca2+-binding RTX toxin-like protein